MRLAKFVSAVILGLSASLANAGVLLSNMGVDGITNTAGDPYVEGNSYNDRFIIVFSTDNSYSLSSLSAILSGNVEVAELWSVTTSDNGSSTLDGTYYLGSNLDVGLSPSVLSGNVYSITPSVPVTLSQGGTYALILYSGTYISWFESTSSYTESGAHFLASVVTHDASATFGPGNPNLSFAVLGDVNTVPEPSLVSLLCILGSGFVARRSRK